MKVIEETSVLSLQLICKSKTILKLEVYLHQETCFGILHSFSEAIVANDYKLDHLKHQKWAGDIAQ
jgi:hypothetical protein